MKKKKKHKWKYQINVKKKVIVLLVLGVSLFVGLGYALLGGSIGLNGNLTVAKYNKRATDAFLRGQNGGCVKKYNNQHKDSTDTSKSTEDIYYYDGTNYNTCPIQEMNNVVFADSCWQMIRTTDTGGVRMLYNGEPEITEVNGETQYNCGSTRSPYHIGGIKSTVTMYTSYKYAASYTSDSNGIYLTDPQTVTIDSNNVDADVQSIIQNYPYMCTNMNATTNKCTGSFYKLDSQVSGATVYAYSSISYRDVIGTSGYSDNTRSVSRVGYKYGDDYITGSFDATYTKNLSGSGIISDTSLTNLSQLKNYSDSISYVNDQYELDTPVAIASDIDRDLLVGKFVERQVSSTKTYYYITKNNGSSFSARQLTNGNTDVEIKISNTAYNNTLTEPSSSMLTITLADWAANYSSYVGKYTCGDSSNTCEYPRYIRTTSATGYTYTSIKPMYIGKSVDSNLQLVDYTYIPEAGSWNNGYNSGLQNYPYTCEDNTRNCTAENLRYITARTATSYTVAYNYKFGSTVIYEDNKYKLQNVVDASALINSNTLNSHHYTCLGGTGATECTSVAYVHAYKNGKMYYIVLNDPTVTTSTAALDNMLTKNTTDSLIKTKIDAWYESKFKNTAYEAKIDDTIYCNDRSYSPYSNTALNKSGWYPAGGNMQQDLFFKDYQVLQPTSINIKCSRETDQFSVSNNQAKLDYPIGLISVSEMRLLGGTGNNSARVCSNEYWTSSPASSMINGSSTLNEGIPSVLTVKANGNMEGAWTVHSTRGIRPAISLTKETEFYRGNGSTTNPYVVDMQGPVKINSWKRTRLSSTTIDDTSAKTTIHNLGSTRNGNDLATIEYYTTCDSGTATGTVNNPSSASINGTKARITIMACEKPVLHYHLVDTQGNTSEWNHVNDIGQYLLYGQIYNNLIWSDNSASNDDENISHWVYTTDYVNTCDKMSHISYYDEHSTSVCDNLSKDELVDRAYLSFLSRESDSNKATWVSKLNNGEETIESFIKKFLNSSEAKNIRDAWGYDTSDCPE